MKTFIAILSLSSLAVADFLIGNCASHKEDPEGKDKDKLPGSALQCDYLAVPIDAEICDVTEFIRTHNDGGVCPGNDGNRSLDFCSAELSGSGCPSSFQMNTRDDCGDIVLAHDGRMPPDGTFYADLIDTAKNNIAVGRCVYEKADAHDCSEDNKKESCKTFIKCYTGMYGADKC